jgi:hypothetical protein
MTARAMVTIRSRRGFRWALVKGGVIQHPTKALFQVGSPENTISTAKKQEMGEATTHPLLGESLSMYLQNTISFRFSLMLVKKSASDEGSS